jgi:hypothetical protein
VFSHFYVQLGGNSMATECIPQLTFEFHPKVKTVARFDQAHASIDGGVVLLKAVDEQLQLTERLAACLPDGRDPDKIRHAVRELLQQRVFGLACGYEDGNDAARLADDPLHKLAVGRDPLTGAALASQPTVSRFENAVDPRSLYRSGSNARSAGSCCTCRSSLRGVPRGAASRSPSGRHPAKQSLTVQQPMASILTQRRRVVESGQSCAI